MVNSDWSMNCADKLLTQYIISDDNIPKDALLNIRIGNKFHKRIKANELWDKIVELDDAKISHTYHINGTISIDLRFTDTIVCIDDKNSQYKDYSLSVDECMAKINYISMDKFSYSITTDSFGFDYNENEHYQHPIPDYDYDTEMATMGCRTLIGYDVNGMGYKKTGRGNVTPVTINLAKIGLDYGIALGKRAEADIDGFATKLNCMLELAEKALLNRFNYICSQNYKSGRFMYVNGVIADSKASIEKGIFESMKHGTNAIGYIGVGEAMYALFGKYHNQDKIVLEFAIKVVETIHNYAKDATARNHLNFSAYATPAEGASHTICKNLQKEYGKISGVCDREYITNSHHVPVFEHVSIYDKIDIESKFTKYPGGGCITYIEMESNVMNNPSAVEKVINFAMSKDIPYFAINFPIDNCTECGFSSEIENTCPKCGASSISRLRRVSGYLSTSVDKFNKGKQAECKDRYKHSKKTKL